MSDPKIILTRKLPAVTEQRLAELFDVTVNANDRQMTQAELASAGAECDVLACTLGDQLDSDFFENAGPRLKMIANFGAGIDHIDIAAAEARGVVVTNTPSVLAEDAADMAMALILAVPRRLVEGVMSLQTGEFSGWSPTWMLGRSIRDKKLGIIGLGRVGQAVARRAGAFGLKVAYHNRNRINPHTEEELKAEWHDTLDSLLASADIVLVSCPATPLTSGLLSRDRLAQMKPAAFLVNIARSGIVDEEALADMIETGRLAGAGLDVFSPDPVLRERFLKARNVVRLPHMASATIEAREHMGDRLIINIKMCLDGHKPPDRIIPEML